MSNDITRLLSIQDTDIKVISIVERSGIRTITIEKKSGIHFCDLCGCRMYSKGIYKRTVNHPVMQDGLQLKISIHQRRWRCINPDCRHTETDEFSFVEPRRRNTNISDLLIVNAFRNPAYSAREIARRHGVSDTHAITTFARYVDMPRRQFTEAISVDEVHLNISKVCNYALVIQDFATGEPIDMIINRREEITEPYFASIPIGERRNVKYLITDMYRPYLSYVDKYFPNAINVVDAFHVIKHINNEFHAYIRSVIRKLNAEDHARHEKRQQEFHRTLPFHHSRDYYVLKKYNWILLKNKDDIRYSTKPRFDKRLNRLMTTYDYEEWVLSLDNSFSERRKLKEKYIQFNKRYAGNPDAARDGLREIICLYRNSKYKMFRDIADTLQDFFEPIANSFIMTKRISKNGVQYESRLSNGPMESLNRIPKDMKRNGRGYLNFYHLRNRFLFSQRKNAAILAIPKPLKEVLALNHASGIKAGDENE